MSELKGYNDDDAQLAQMGHKPQLKRQFSLLYVALLGLPPKPDHQADIVQIDARSCVCYPKCTCA